MKSRPDLVSRVISLFVCSLFVCLGVCHGAEAEVSAISADWPYRRIIGLDVATSRPDSVVLVVVLTTQTMGNPYMHVNHDGSDLRFTAAKGAGPEGKTLLSYWIESWDRAGESKIWVKIPSPGTEKIYVHYGNAKAKPASDGKQVFDFFDDFNDGIWRKHSGNPVITRTEPWEARAICEPSVLYEDGIYKMWYMGCATSVGTNAALGYATSPDGLNWTKLPGNPILQDPTEAVIRTTVVKHQGTYYLFATDYQWNDAPGNIRRWTSTDGLNWTDKTIVLRPGPTWEQHFQNIGITIDSQGIWHMLYTIDGPFGYAYSKDGLHWTKHKTPVITDCYGGDPYLTKIGDTFYTWHSQLQGGDLLIYARKSTDMINWQMVGNGPQVGYTQPWERGVGRPEVHWSVHLTDAELMERDGRVWMYYQGVQCPLGVAWFDGTMQQLGEAMENPPMQQWAASHYHSVEDKQLKVSHNATKGLPVYESAEQFSDREGYTLQCRVRCYAGYRQESTSVEPEGWSCTTKCFPASTTSVAVVIRYIDDNNLARFRLDDDKTAYYEERVGGVWAATVKIGSNLADDADWHRWKIVVAGDNNQLYIDDKLVGAHKSNPALQDRKDLRVGFSVSDTFASFDDVRVRKYAASEAKAKIGPEEKVSK